jgi:hypothetical protein
MSQRFCAVNKAFAVDKSAAVHALATQRTLCELDPSGSLLVTPEEVVKFLQRERYKLQGDGKVSK